MNLIKLISIAIQAINQFDLTNAINVLVTIDRIISREEGIKSIRIWRS